MTYDISSNNGVVYFHMGDCEKNLHGKYTFDSVTYTTDTKKTVTVYRKDDEKEYLDLLMTVLLAIADKNNSIFEKLCTYDKIVESVDCVLLGDNRVFNSDGSVTENSYFCDAEIHFLLNEVRKEGDENKLTSFCSGKCNCGKTLRGKNVTLKGEKASAYKSIKISYSRER